MKTFWVVLLSIVSATICVAQRTETIDSFALYQHHYKQELYNIIKQDTVSIQFFKYNASLKVKARVEHLYQQPTFSMPTASGKTKQAQQYAIVHFKIKRKVYKLYVYHLLNTKPNSVDTNLFIAFRDKTSGNTTYGGGRYIDVTTAKLRDPNFKLDFNLAYHPYCAYTTGYNCPIPPAENYVNTYLNAGESYNATKFHKEDHE
jgi:uncharacterized protein (DUF1684 family)